MYCIVSWQGMRGPGMHMIILWQAGQLVNVSISVCDLPGVRLQHGAVGSRNCLAAWRWKDWMLDRSRQKCHQKSHQKCHQTRHNFHHFKTKLSSLYLHQKCHQPHHKFHYFKTKLSSLYLPDWWQTVRSQQGRLPESSAFFKIIDCYNAFIWHF